MKSYKLLITEIYSRATSRMVHIPIYNYFSKNRCKRKQRGYTYSEDSKSIILWIISLYYTKDISASHTNEASAWKMAWSKIIELMKKKLEA